jgi:hypothetical protein
MFSRTTLTLLLLPLVHGEEGGTSCENLMAELSLVAILHLLVVVVSVVLSR